MKKWALDLILGVLLVIVLAVAAAYVLARQPAAAAPAEAQPTDDLTVRAAQIALQGGELTVSPGELNTLLLEKVPTDDFPALQSVQVAADITADAVPLLLCVSDGHRNWTVTVTGTVEGLETDGEISAITFTPSAVRIGRLPVPAAIWTRLASRLDAWDAESRCIAVEVQLPVKCIGVTVSADGITLTVPSVVEKAKENLESITELWQSALERLKNGTSWAELYDEWTKQLSPETVNALMEKLKNEWSASDPSAWRDALRNWWNTASR